MPRPGSQVIPAGWSDHHQPVTVGTMTARCTIDRDGDGPPVWNDAAGEYDPIPRVILHADLPCRIQQWKLPLIADVGQQQVSTHHYLVPIPLNYRLPDGRTAATSNVAIDQQVLVTECTDSSLIGRRLSVTGVLRGSLAWERDLIALDNLG